MPYEEEDACLYSIVLPYSGTPTQNTLLRGGGCEGADEAAGDDPAACVCVCLFVCVCVCVCVLRMSVLRTDIRGHMSFRV